MATCLAYAKIAFAAYFTRTSQYYDDPPGHMVDDWTVQKWETGTLFGNGFQGGIWQNDTDVVVGCCGTNPGQKGKLFQDAIADLKIVLRLLPSQSQPARRMVQAAKSIAAGRRVSVTGHSLGGGLAQIAGLSEGVPFVTFNAPAMAQALERTPAGARAAETSGLNFRIAGDLVSTHGPRGIGGGHVGTVVDLTKNAAYTQLGRHGKDTCWQMVLETDWAFVDPFEALGAPARTLPPSSQSGSTSHLRSAPPMPSRSARIGA